MLDRQLHLAEAAPEHRRVLGQRQDQVGQIAGTPLDVLEDDRVVDDQRHGVVDAEAHERALDLIDQRRRLERDANLAGVEIDLAAQPALQLVPEPGLAVDRLGGRHGDLNLADQPHAGDPSRPATRVSGVLPPVRGRIGLHRDHPDEDLAHRRQRGGHGRRRVVGAHVRDPRPHHQGRAEVGGGDRPRHRRGSEERPARRGRPRPGGEAARLPEPTLAHRAPRPLRLPRGVHALEPHRRAARRSPRDHALRAVRAPADRLHQAVVGGIGAGEPIELPVDLPGPVEGDAGDEVDAGPGRIVPEDRGAVSRSSSRSCSSSC